MNQIFAVFLFDLFFGNLKFGWQIQLHLIRIEVPVLGPFELYFDRWIEENKVCSQFFAFAIGNAITYGL